MHFTISLQTLSHDDIYLPSSIYVTSERRSSEDFSKLNRNHRLGEESLGAAEI